MAGRVLIIVPTYNEAENIERLVGKLLALGQVFDVLVVDDNSPDGTGRLADLLSQHNPGRVFVLHRPAKSGLGTAHRDGFRLALEKGYQRIVTMDADFSHPPAAIPEMIEKLAEADLVIGSRYVAGGQTRGWSWLRKLNSWTANFLARWLMGLKVRDATGAFRACSSEYLRKIPLDRLRARGYAANLELLYYFQKLGARVLEVPITFINRQQGKSKISTREIKEALRIMLFYFFRRPEA